MNKNLRIIQINGFKGFFIIGFVTVCLAAGFIAFPALVAMTVWNLAAAYIAAIPSINFGQGLLLWIITAICGFILNVKKKTFFSFHSQNNLSDTEIQRILDNVRNQNSDNLEIQKEEEKENL